MTEGDGRYSIALMFEWRGGCLWPRNDAAYERFDVGPIEDDLPLSPEAAARLEELSEWHDSSLDWSYPQGPSPWSAAKFEAFDAAAEELLAQIRRELGPEFTVVYERVVVASGVSESGMRKAGKDHTGFSVLGP
jgi:hypothetical protein